MKKGGSVGCREEWVDRGLFRRWNGGAAGGSSAAVIYNLLLLQMDFFWLAVPRVIVCLENGFSAHIEIMGNSRGLIDCYSHFMLSFTC